MVSFSLHENGNFSMISDTTTLCFPRKMTIDHSALSEYIYIGMNDGGYGPNVAYEAGRKFEECNYLNNYDSILVSNILPPIDLGPDVIACINEPIVLNVPSFYTSYLWNDFSVDSTYTAAYPRYSLCRGSG